MFPKGKSGSHGFKITVSISAAFEVSGTAALCQSPLVTPDGELSGREAVPYSSPCPECYAQTQLQECALKRLVWCKIHSQRAAWVPGERLSLWT